MRHRRVRDSTRTFRRLPDPQSIESAPAFSDDALLDAGVRPDVITELQQRIRDHALSLTAEALRRLLLTLEDTPSGVALRRSILGDDGIALSSDARAVGTSKQALSVSVQRIRKRLRKLTG